MKRDKGSRKPMFNLNSEICRSVLYWTFVLGGIVGAIFSFCRLFLTSRKSTLNEKTGDIVSHYDTILPFEPPNSFFPLFWLSVAFVLLSISALCIVYAHTMNKYYDDWDDLAFYGGIITFALAAPIFGMILPTSNVVKNHVGDQNFKIATNYVYGQDAKKSDVYQVGDDAEIDKVNQQINKISAKNSGNENDLAFNIKNYENDAIYPIFQVVQVDGEPHLIVSEKQELDNVKELQDLGKVTPAQISDLTNYLH